MGGEIKKTNGLNKSVLTVGLVLFIFGSLFLISNFSTTVNTPLLWSTLVIIIGLSSLTLVIKFKKGQWLFFVTIILILYGTYFCVLFSGVFAPNFSLVRTWPILSAIAGMALFPAGLRHYKKPKFVYVIPALAFIVLSVIMFLFSSGIIILPIKRFMLRTMPLFMIFAGMLLILISIFSRKHKTKQCV